MTCNQRESDCARKPEERIRDFFLSFLFPGPCTPHRSRDPAGTDSKLAGKIPDSVLGVCLGHKRLGGGGLAGKLISAGAEIVSISKNGKTSQIRPMTGAAVFSVLPESVQPPTRLLNTLNISLIVERKSLPRELQVTAEHRLTTSLWGMHTQEYPLMGVNSNSGGRLLTESGQAIA